MIRLELILIFIFSSMLKVNDPEGALVIYKKVIYISEVEDKNHEMVRFYEQAISLALKLEKYLTCFFAC